MAIVAVMMVVGFSAFKVANTLNDDPENGWYSVEQINPSAFEPNHPSNLRITGYIATSLDPLSSCKPEETEEDVCAVKLKLENFTQTSPISMTVEDAVNPATNKAEIDDSETEDGFAREEVD